MKISSSVTTALVLLLVMSAHGRTITTVPGDAVIIESEYADYERRALDWERAFGQMNAGPNLSITVKTGNATVDYTNIHNIVAVGSLLKVSLRISGDRRTTLFLRPEDVLMVRDNP